LRTLFYLVRHGDTGVRNKIAGRISGVHLNDHGRAQAVQLVERFRNIPIDALYSSPLERANETAQPLSTAFNLDIQAVEDISEIDYGEWTGKSFDDLSSDPRWRSFNSFRSTAQIPGGENIMDVQTRFVRWVEKTRRESAHVRVVAISHQDPIKTVVTHYAGMHIDTYGRFEIGHASVTVVEIDDGHAGILTLNNVGVLPD
jgi:broad specificity phosphatase PhoE